MKEIIVKNQKDFDAIKDQDERTKIRIESLPTERILIEKVPANCFISCWDSSQPTIECGDSSQPTIECWASSQPTIECGDSSQPTIECWDSSQPTIECWASSQPTIECWASSQPIIECGDSSQPTIDAWQQSTLVMRGDKKQVTTHQQSLVRYISEEKSSFASVKAWLKYWELTPKDGKVTLFKAVRPNSKSFNTGSVGPVLYADGATVECPDWLENFDEECGHGLHCSPHLFLTELHAQNPHIHKAVDVDISDIRLPKGSMSMPDKVRVKKVQNIRSVDEKGRVKTKEA